MKPRYEVADILNRNLDNLDQICKNTWKLRTLSAIAACRTSKMGYHIDQCDNTECQEIHISYNSCRNRHCPKCQGHKTLQWIQKREAELFNTSYYHVVFTIPDILNKSCMIDPRLLYSLLFKISWSVINDFGANHKFLGARTGMIAVLHTWGQNLSLHPHLHCIVPGGGLTASGKWKQVKGKNKFLFPVKQMSKVFRARFMAELRTYLDLPDSMYKTLISKPWVVYCKQPFFGPKQVIEYIGRYTHKVAISNHRIKSIDNNTVSFTWKDYRKSGQKSIMPLSDYEFIRRFTLHILPKGLTRIRYYGILSSTLKSKTIPIIQDQIGHVYKLDKPEEIYPICPKCKKGRMFTIAIIKGRGPPVFDLVQLVQGQ